jgi:hypothetical protein
MPRSDREQKDNTGVLFDNDRKESDRHPDYRGSATINGVEFWVSCWENESRDGKTLYKSLVFTEKDEEDDRPRRSRGRDDRDDDRPRSRSRRDDEDDRRDDPPRRRDDDDRRSSRSRGTTETREERRRREPRDPDLDDDRDRRPRDIPF